MPSAKDFTRAFERATERSSRYDEFRSMLQSLEGSLNADSKSASIKLNTDKKGSDSRVVEDAVREKFGDDLKRSRYPDALFGNLPVEVKHTTSGFGKLPTDSYGLTNTDQKWYLFVKGSVDRVKDEIFTAWMMRSDELYREMISLLRGTNQESLFPHKDLSAIDPQSDTALKDIEQEIHDIASSLSLSILRKAKGQSEKDVPETMSLSKRVGINRVRFDVKFESKLRKIIADIIND